MKNTDKSKGKYKHMLPQLLLGALIGAFAGFWGAGTGVEILGRESGIWGIIAGIGLIVAELYAAMYLQIIFHEGGYLVCGLLSGYRFVSYRVGNWILIKSGNAWKLKRYRIPGTGGQCLLAPPDWQDGNCPYVFYNAGGVLFNLLSSVLFLALFLLFRDNHYVSGLFLMTALIGVYLAVMNGIPMRIGGIENDACNVRSMKKDMQARRSFWVMTEVNSQNAKGVRLKDMPDEWFEQPDAAEMDNGLKAGIGVLAFERAVDEHDFEKAWRLGEHLLQKAKGMTDVHRYLVTADMMFCSLLLDRERETYMGYLEDKQFVKMLQVLSTFPSVLRTRYACELRYRKNEETAGKIRTSFEKLAKTYPYGSEIEGERELMEIIAIDN